jgi:RHS repeat-associated protein
MFSAAYDAENRLISLVYTNGGGVVFSNQYLYRWTDFLAETKQYQNGLLTNDIRFLRAGYFPLQERDSNNNVVQEYAWDFRKRGGIGGLLNLIRAGQSYSYTYDGKGNVAAVLDGSQNTAASYAYDPFGILQGTSGALNQPFGFSSKPYDLSTGLSDFGFRFYAPVLGRWLNRDPIAERGGINLYAYANGNPIMFKDPLGLCSDNIARIILETILWKVR